MLKNLTNQTITNHSSFTYFNYNSIKEITDKVKLYIFYLVFCFGIIGNLISMFIFTRPNLNKKSNAGLLYTILCMFNILTFIEHGFIGTFQQAILVYYSISLPCRTEFFIRQSLYQILSWIQVLICFDRFFLVIYPTKAYLMRKKVLIL